MKLIRLIALVGAVFTHSANAQECIGTAVRDASAIFRDENMIWDKCAEFSEAKDCVIKEGEHLIITGMALLPRYTTETFFFLRRHETFTCYPAQDFVLDDTCNPDNLPMINGVPCGP